MSESTTKLTMQKILTEIAQDKSATATERMRALLAMSAIHETDPLDEYSVGFLDRIINGHAA
ncbi:MAG: hypothetical protein OXC10_14565 [Rhodospirillaceae bacterium]|nr:hypothetical protein [Rhodospirillaceae bacterium]